MVPFSPDNLHSEDFRPHRAEYDMHPRVHNTLPAPPFYSSSAGGRWGIGHAHLYSTKGETTYEHSPEQYASYVSGSAAHAFGPTRDQYGIPHGITQQTYTNGILQELKCDHFGASRYCFDYGIGCSMPSISQNIIDLDLPSDLPRRATSPNSTISGSEVGSVAFPTDERLSNPTTLEPDTMSPELTQPHCAFFHKHNVFEIADNGSNTEKVNHRKTVPPTERDLERRRKNNAASRKSRAQRKDRCLMDLREMEYLKIENKKLKDFQAELELAIKEANDALISRFKYRLPTTS